MNRLYLDQANKKFLDDWAARNSYVIVSASAPDSESLRQYAADNGAEAVPDPRGGHPGMTLVVRRTSPAIKTTRKL